MILLSVGVRQCCVDQQRKCRKESWRCEEEEEPPGRAAQRRSILSMMDCQLGHQLKEVMAQLGEKKEEFGLQHVYLILMINVNGTNLSTHCYSAF